MIRFHCENCGQKLSVPQTKAGKKGRCPKCKNIVVVPKVEDTKSVANQTKPGASEISSKDSILDQNLFDIPQESKVEDYLIAQGSVSDKAFEELQKPQESKGIKKVEPEPVPRRKLPWIIDIFLYPASKPGLTILGIIIVIPLLFKLIVQLLGAFTRMFPPMLIFLVLFAVIGFIVDILLALYMYWYICECIRDSAAGGLRAPETMAETPGIWELRQVFDLFACFIVCAASAAVYFGYMRRFDTTFWLLAGGGAFLFPMALLAVIMFGSINGLNPLIIIPSIFSTFFQYCGLVVLIAAIIFLYVLTIKFLPSNLFIRMVLSTLVQAVELYLAMVAAHLLGRFYFKYQEKLNWEV
jgi:DNA-directed RNA polymerase subunit RPC12/RpoP